MDDDAWEANVRCNLPMLVFSLIASSTQAETIKVDVWPSTKTISLSTSAVIRSLPQPGTRMKAAVRHFGSDALNYRYVSPLVSVENNPDGQIAFEAPSLSRSVDDLLRQYDDLEETVENTLSEFSGRGPSSGRPDTAELDQFSPAVFPPGAEERIQQARLTILSVLWDDSFLKLTTRAIDSSSKESVQSLEEAVSGKISASRAKLAAALTGLDISDVSGAAPRLLADEIRRRKIGVVPTIEDPSLPTRSYRINDPNLLNVNYKWRGSLQQFKAYVTDYCLAAEPYWQSVIEKKILNKDDVAMLKSWHFIDSQFVKAPADAPATYVRTLCDNTQAGLLRRQADAELRAEIARLTVYYWMCSTSLPCENFAYLPKEQKRMAIAREAGKNIAADDKIIPAHFGDYEVMLPLVSRYFADLAKLNVGKLRALSGDAATDRAILAPIIGDYIASEIESTLIATTFNLGLSIEVDPFIFSPWQIEARFRPITEIAGTIRDMLARPVELNRYLMELQEWRAGNADAASIPAGITFTTERAWRKANGDWERFNAARRNNDRAKDVAQAIFALNSALGFSDLLHHQDGRVLLPDDSVVEALHVVAGEQVEAAQPVLTVAHLFSRHGRAFVDSERLGKLNLLPGHAFVITDVAGTQTAPPEVQVLMIVLAVEPRRTGEFEVNFELAPAFDTKLLAGKPEGISEFLRVQWRFCRAGIEVYVGASCEAAEKLLPRVGTMEVTIEREVAQ
ncbi:hypothetical protein [Sinorhizobium meliloti]|uniref:hypothetical protein n=1 Tax=Rhizobium meliloti TaxID=382 RepID=UPI003F1538D5